jgi:hypothetical protein
VKKIVMVWAVLMLVSGAWSQQGPGTPGAPDPAALFGIQDAGSESGEKSVLLAAGLSLVLPGMGELYTDNFGTGKYFLAADGVLWLTYAGLSLSSGWVQDDADVYITQHAGASLAGKDDQFRVDVGNYLSVYEYNEAKLRAREYASLYDPAQNYWNWDSDPNRNSYRDLRISSDQLQRDATFVIGALVVNRLISAFVAGRSAAAYNERVRESRSWNLGARVIGGPLNPQGIELRLRLVL